MGLGKTVMILALILRSRAEGNPTFNKKEDKWLSTNSTYNKMKNNLGFTQTNHMCKLMSILYFQLILGELVPSRCTLIIVPPGVLGQWESEIKLKTKNMKVLLYHGPKRAQISAAG
jgi:SNF2 family DNA or RNA helicase